jgi:hypothetical protein
LLGRLFFTRKKKPVWNAPHEIRRRPYADPEKAARRNTARASNS